MFAISFQVRTPEQGHRENLGDVILSPEFRVLLPNKWVEPLREFVYRPSQSWQCGPLNAIVAFVIS